MMGNLQTKMGARPTVTDAQGKDEDWPIRKLYFGARCYDPFFGLWMFPDPAGQFANPYTYGGDPLNYIDPTGMWSEGGAVGLGLVVSWDETHGWGFGPGVAAYYGDYGFNLSYVYNQDGSNTLSLGADAKIPIQTPYVYIEINMGLGFSMNSYSGAVLSTHGGACVGEVGNCVGVDQGGSLYWDRNGGFQGATAYTEVYMQYAGELRVATGYEVGLYGAEGRGLYVDGSAFGLHAGVSHLEDGYDPDNVYYGYHKQVDVMNYEWIDENSRLSILGLDVYLRMIMGPNGMYTGRQHTRLMGNGLMNDGEGVYTFFAHGSPFAIGVEEGLRSLSAEEFAVLLKAGYFNYKDEKIIKLYACNTAGATEDGSMNFAQRLAEAMNVTVIAPTTRVNAEQIFGTTKVVLMDHGLWHRCQPGAGCQPYQDAIGEPINWW